MTAAVPVAMRRVIHEWRDAGRPRQDGITWPRRRWISRFPQHHELFDRLPDRLGRDDVQDACRSAANGRTGAERAFLTVMAWGYGNVGYGPWRTERVLHSDPDAVARLTDVAATLASSGAIDAYAQLAGNHRLVGLGPAFGTKYLFFCPQSDPVRPALILDRLIADWLHECDGYTLNPVRWSKRTYRRYVERMWAWAAALDVAPDVLEERIFVDEARERGTQWA